MATPINAHKTNLPISALLTGVLFDWKIYMPQSKMLVTPTLMMLMAKGWAKPAFTINFIAVRLMAKKRFVPSRAACAFVVAFKKIEF
jgi:hypothetical protein